MGLRPSPPVCRWIVSVLPAARGAAVAVAVAAVDRLAVRRVERNLGRLAARVAGDAIELAGAAVSVTTALALVAAHLAALRFVGEPLLGVELLLVRREGEGAGAVDAIDGLVRVHGMTPWSSLTTGVESRALSSRRARGRYARS